MSHHLSLKCEVCSSCWSMSDEHLRAPSVRLSHTACMTRGLLLEQCCRNWNLKHCRNTLLNNGRRVGTLLQQWKPRALLAHNYDLITSKQWPQIILLSSYSSNNVHSLFELWLSTKQPGDVTTRDVAWRTSLEYRVLRSLRFQSCSESVSSSQGCFLKRIDRN